MKPRSRILHWTIAVYRFCLWCYPQDHRQQYGSEMMQVVGDCCRAAHRQQGMLGVVALWFPILWDTLVTVVQERRKRGVHMPVELLQRISPYLLMVGGVLFGLAGYSQLQPGSHYDFYGLYMASLSMLAPGWLFLAVGMLGVYYQLRARLARGGRIAAIVVVVAKMTFAISFFWLFVFDVPEIVWQMGMFTILLVLVSLLIFGIESLRAGMWIGVYPLVVVGLLVGLFVASSVMYPAGDSWGPLYLDFAVQVAVGLVWVLFGTHLLRLAQPAAHAEF